MQDAEKQFAKTRSEADKLKLETAQADYDNMVRNLKSVTKAAGDTEKAISKIEDTATGSSNAFSGIVGAIAQTGITKLVGDAEGHWRGAHSVPRSAVCLRRTVPEKQGWT